MPLTASFLRMYSENVLSAILFHQLKDLALGLREILLFLFKVFTQHVTHKL